MILRLRHAVAAVVALCACFTSIGFALENDPALARLCVPNPVSPPASSNNVMRPLWPCGENPVADVSAYRNLAKEYGVALGPQLSSPAKTLGINGFQFDLQFAITSINNTETYWVDGVEDKTPESQLMVTRVGLRKGLAASIELGSDVAYLVNSEMWTLGAFLKWSPHEMMADFPIDMSIRGSLSKTVGSSQLELTMTGADVVIGKTFGVGGVVSFSPYVGYSPLWVLARSGILDSTPGEAGTPGEFVFPEETIMVQRFAFGIRSVTGLFSFTPEFVLAEKQQTVNVNLGLNF